MRSGLLALISRFESLFLLSQPVLKTFQNYRLSFLTAAVEKFA